jgi:hypothetical protein
MLLLRTIIAGEVRRPDRKRHRRANEARTAARTRPAFVSAAVRLDQIALRAWLRRRARQPPLAAPVDPARFTISDADIALLMRAAREAPGEARTDRDEADGD